MGLVLDIGQHTIKIIVLKTKKNKVFIEKCLKKELPNGMVKNGHLTDMSFSIFLKKILKENKIYQKNCTVIINSTDIVSREFTVPIVNKKQLFLLINNQIEDRLGKMSDYSKDFTIIKKILDNKNEEKEIKKKSIFKKFNKSKKNNKDKGIYNILAYAIPNDIINSWYKAIQAAGLRPAKMELEYNCIAKIFNNSQINNVYLDDKSVVSVYITEERVVFNLIIYGMNGYSREINFYEEGFVTPNNKDELLTNTDIQNNKKLLYDKITAEIINLMQFSLSKRIRKQVSNIFIFGELQEYFTIYEYLKNTLYTTKVESINSVSTIINKKNKSQIQNAIISAGSAMRWKL